MKLTKLFEQGATLSFEVFPPKSTTTFENVAGAVREIAALSPDFMSVTYGAGGSTDRFTAAMAQLILQCGVTPLAHLSCIGASRLKIDAALSALAAAGIENVLALRGDIPEGFEGEISEDFHHANELVAYIKSHGDFCVGAACYPEAHPESASPEADLKYLKQKADAGCDFLTSQMFFDNDLFYAFVDRARRAGITARILPGVMPITNESQIKRIAQLSGAALPPQFRRMVERFGSKGAAMRQAGVAYATQQILDLLADGVQNIHVYSMNKPDIAKEILENVCEALRA